MFRTEITVGLLKSIAMIAGLAILLWSLGLPSLQFANAANLVSESDTISDSAPSASANHTFEFTHPVSGSGVAGTETIVIDFSDGPFDLTDINTEDIDLLVDDSNIAQVGNWTVANGGTDITITLDAGFSIDAGSSTQILIGTNATNEGSPDTQIVNPAAEGSYEISVTAGTDTGSTRVVILSSVEVTASVDTVFTFAVAGVDADVAFNGTATTTGATGSTTIPFGTLIAGQATTSAQQLTVNTNASNGYTVTVQVDGPLESSAGGIIDGFNESAGDDPSAWASPSPDVEDPTTWGHWGVTSDDTTTTRSDEFAVGEYIAASTSARVVMEHDGPASGVDTGIGTTYVGYKVEITGLQEAGEDYSTTLTYIATPTF